MRIILSHHYPEAPIHFPHGIAVTDLNGNGRSEIVVIRFSFPGGVQLPIPVFELGPAPDGGEGDDGAALVFTDVSSTILTVGRPSTDFGRDILRADLNGDGWDDLLIADHGFDREPFPGAINRVYLSDGSGRLVDRSPDFSRGPDFTHSIAAGDIDGDGRADILFGNIGVDRAYLAVLDGEGTVVHDAFPWPTDIGDFTTAAMADLDGSGRDTIVLGAAQIQMSGQPDRLLRWHGAAFEQTLLPVTEAFTSAIALDVEVVDFNGDGLPDIVFLHTSAEPFYTGAAVQFLAQQPDGTFSDVTRQHINPEQFARPWYPWARYIAFGDVDGDGRLDMVVESSQFFYHEIFLQREDGWFSRVRDRFDSPLDIRRESLALADITGDGVSEVIAVGSTSLQVLSLRDTVTPVVLRDGGDRARLDTAPARLVGGSGDDVIVAVDVRGNRIDFSAGGNNRVLLGGGDDVVIGGPGNDVILAGRGGDNFINLSAGGDNRVTTGDGIDRIIGGSGRDVIRPGRGNDLVDLRAGGDNFVFNLRGDATILGGVGDDVIFGGIGNTLILAGGGNNRIVAGPGRDTIGFVQGSHETRLLDFRPGSDTLDFTGHDRVSSHDDLTLRQIGTSTIIDDGSGGRVVLAGIDLAVLDDAIFVFMG